MKYLILALFGFILGMFTNVTATEVTAIEKGVYFDVGANEGTAQHIDVFIPVAPVYDDDVGPDEAVASHYISKFTYKTSIRPAEALSFRRARDGLRCNSGKE